MFNIDKEVPHCGLDLSPLPGLLKYLNRGSRGLRPGLLSVAAPRLRPKSDGRVNPRFTPSAFLHLTNFPMNQTFQRSIVVIRLTASAAKPAMKNAGTSS